MGDLYNNCVRMIRPIDIFKLIADVSRSPNIKLRINRSEVNTEKIWKSFVGVELKMRMLDDNTFKFIIHFDGAVNTIGNGFIMTNGDMLIHIYNNTQIITIQMTDLCNNQIKFQ